MGQCVTQQYIAITSNFTVLCVVKEITHVKTYSEELKKNLYDFHCFCFYCYNCPVVSLQMIKLVPIFSTLITKNMVPVPAAPVSPGRRLEMQTLRSHPRPTESEAAH